MFVMHRKAHREHVHTISIDEQGKRRGPLDNRKMSDCFLFGATRGAVREREWRFGGEK